MSEERCGFRWKGSAMGTVWYRVTGDGNPYDVEVRRLATDHERRIFNGEEAEWRRDVLGSIDLLRRSGSCDLPIPTEVVAAFNEWLLAEHEKHVRSIKGHPERYGEIADDDPLLEPPRPVKGARYAVGTGWIVETEPGCVPAP